MNNHIKSELPVNRNSPLFRKIVEICGEEPPSDPLILFIPKPIMRKLVNKKIMPPNAGRMLAMLLGEWMAGELVIETDIGSEDVNKAFEYLNKLLFISNNYDLNLCTTNEDQVLSLLNRLFPGKSKS